MSSNIRVSKICIFCNNEFEAKTTVTKYCSLKCASRWNKQKVRNAKIEASNIDVKIKKNPTLTDLKLKELLTVADVSKLLGCSRQMINKLINSGKLKAVKYSVRKTRIKQIDLKAFQAFRYDASQPTRKKIYDVSDCCTIGEAQKIFGVSQSGLRNILIKHNVPKIQKHKFVYVPIAVLEEILK